jgi:glutamate--cysteine ligase
MSDHMHLSREELTSSSAAARAPAVLDEPVRVLARSVEAGRYPADDFCDQVSRHGIAATMTRLAQKNREIKTA